MPRRDKEETSELTGNKYNALYNDKFTAPDFKRRQLIFDSLTKLSNSRAAEGDGSKGTLLYTWGAGYHGQLGSNTYRKKCQRIPSLLEFDEPVTQVSCGGFHNAVLTDSGNIYTWGDGRMGQLGNLARKHNMHSTPHMVEKWESSKCIVAQVACGQYHTACVSTNGWLLAWGANKHGQLGLGTRIDARYPRQVMHPRQRYTAVSCGDRHSAAITKEGRVCTFGSGQHGQLGHGNNADELRPKQIASLAEQRVEQVNCSANMTAAITEGGGLYLWGFGESIHPKESSNIVDSPRIVKLRTQAKQVACGQSHVLVLDANGDVFAFGAASMGQIGHGSLSNVRSPRLVLKGKEIYEIAAGRYHSMAVSSYGVLFSWGCGESGQLAHDSLENELFPKVVEPLLQNVVGAISCGQHHSFCLSSIQHQTIAKDVEHWALVEEEELKLKKKWVKEGAVNGLRSKHVANVDSKRAEIIQQLASELKRHRENDERVLEDQLLSIRDKRELRLEAQENLSKGKMKHSLSMGADGQLTVMAPTVREEGEEDGPRNGHHHSRAVTKRHYRAGGARSLTETGGRREEGNGYEVVSMRGGGGRRNYSLQLSATQPLPLQAVGEGEDGEGKVQEAGREGEVGLPAYQPLAPRLVFMEKTRTSLAKVKRYLQSEGVLSSQTSQTSVLGLKKSLNVLKEDSRTKELRLVDLRNHHAQWLVTEEDLVRQSANDHRIKELNMKLVTLNTRLMEAEENKKNYELYILRMKEEDVQLSRQIDHLRNLVVEYDRLLAKMGRMNARVTGQREEIHEEINRFDADIAEFAFFAEDQVNKYRGLITKHIKQQIEQQQHYEDKRKRREEWQRQKQQEEEAFDQQASEAIEVADELEGWNGKVEYYEKRFHKITAATGLNTPEEIINKFFFNDEIHEDLKAEVEGRKKKLQSLEAADKEAKEALAAKKGGFKLSKWRDVDKKLGQSEATTKREARGQTEVSRVQKALASVLEALVAMSGRVDRVMQHSGEAVADPNPEDEKLQDPLTECEPWCEAWANKIGKLYDRAEEERKRWEAEEEQARLQSEKMAAIMDKVRAKDLKESQAALARSNMHNLVGDAKLKEEIDRSAAEDANLEVAEAEGVEEDEYSDN